MPAPDSPTHYTSYSTEQTCSRVLAWIKIFIYSIFVPSGHLSVYIYCSIHAYSCKWHWTICVPAAVLQVPSIYLTQQQSDLSISIYLSIHLSLFLFLYLSVTLRVRGTDASPLPAAALLCSQCLGTKFWVFKHWRLHLVSTTSRLLK